MVSRVAVLGPMVVVLFVNGPVAVHVSVPGVKKASRTTRTSTFNDSAPSPPLALGMFPIGLHFPVEGL